MLGGVMGSPLSRGIPFVGVRLAGARHGRSPIGGGRLVATHIGGDSLALGDVLGLGGGHLAHLACELLASTIAHGLELGNEALGFGRAPSMELLAHIEAALCFGVGQSLVHALHVAARNVVARDLGGVRSQALTLGVSAVRHLLAVVVGALPAIRGLGFDVVVGAGHFGLVDVFHLLFTLFERVT